jgi:fumarate reductase (CoM/CoB) subunit A
MNSLITSIFIRHRNWRELQVDYEIIDTDVLIIGAGGAGCRAAIEAAKHNVNVTLICKELFGKAHTIMAEGGYNAALANVDKEDNWKLHFYDTVKGGAWINNQKLVNILAHEATERVLDLEEFGAVFDRTDEGKINQRMFGTQTYRRTCFAGDRTGHEMMLALIEETRRLGVRVFDEFFASRLIKTEDTVVGATAVDIKTGSFYAFRAKSTVLASGGAGRVYEVTTNAQCDTGDGFAMGYLAGAELVDMEFVQFHPTGMVYPESCRGVLVTEAVRGEGGRLFNKDRERFMKNYNPELMEMAFRDQVARAIATEILQGRGTKRGGVYLDVTHLPPEVIEQRLPSMLEQFLKVGVDIRKEPMEVSPTAHHFMGGLIINENGETTLKGLYAAGEVTGGVHGGNRLGGNALADTQVMGKRAGENAAKNALKKGNVWLNREAISEDYQRVQALLETKEGTPPVSFRKRLQHLMWNKVGIFRNEQDMMEALDQIIKWRKEASDKMFVENKSTFFNKQWIEALELENMLLVAEMVTRAALERRESRGSHFRRDFPKPNNSEWFVNIAVKMENGQMMLKKIPVTTIYIKQPEVKFGEIEWK